MALTVTIEELIERNENGLLGTHPDWPRFRLGDVAVIQNGLPYSSKLFNTRGQGVPLLRIRDVGNKRTAAFYTGSYEASDLVHSGDLLIGMDGDFKCAKWAGPPAVLNQRVCRVNFLSDRVDPAFVVIVLPGYLEAVNAATSSITVKHLSSKTVGDLLLPLPPRDEQETIVRRVEALDRELDEAVADIKAAMRLTAANRSALYALANPAGAEDRPLRDLLVRIETGKSLKCDPRPAAPGEWGVVKVSAMTWGAFDEEEQKAVPVGVVPDTRNEIRAGDLLFSRANTTQLIGASVLVPGDVRPKLLLSDKSLRLVPAAGVDSGWLHAALNDPQVRARISAMATGTSDSMRNVSQAKLLSITLRVPDIRQQRSLVADVNARLGGLDALLSELRELESAAGALRTAIRRAAVTGALSGRPARILPGENDHAEAVRAYS